MDFTSLCKFSCEKWKRITSALTLRFCRQFFLLVSFGKWKIYANCAHFRNFSNKFISTSLKPAFIRTFLVARRSIDRTILSRNDFFFLVTRNVLRNRGSKLCCHEDTDGNKKIRDDIKWTEMCRIGFPSPCRMSHCKMHWHFEMVTWNAIWHSSHSVNDRTVAFSSLNERKKLNEKKTCTYISIISSGKMSKRLDEHKNRH